MNAVIVIPTLNEADHIRDVIDRLSMPLHDGRVLPIWVVDGGSEDGTPDIVRALGLDHVEVLGNPDRTQAHAVNLASREAAARGGIDVIIRADAHAGYPDGFVAILLEGFAQSGADSIVVPMRTVGGNRIQDAAAILFSTWLGTGGSPHRSDGESRFVDHGHHAAFRLDAFLAVGGYDVGFRANEDAEFDYRLTATGRRIYMMMPAALDYYPRDSFKGTFTQYARNGKGRMMRAFKHNLRLGLRQMLPAVLLPLLVVSTLLALAGLSLFWLLPAGYVTALMVAAFVISMRAGRPGLTPDIVGLALMAHLGFSFGATAELLRCALDRTRRSWLRRDANRLVLPFAGEGVSDRA